jgi:hypothetical protein
VLHFTVIMTATTFVPLTLAATEAAAARIRHNTDQGRMSSSSGGSSSSSVDVYKSLPYKRKSLPSPRAFYHAPHTAAHDLKAASTLLQHHQQQQQRQHVVNSHSSAATAGGGLLSYEGAMSLRGQMLTVHHNQRQQPSQQSPQLRSKYRSTVSAAHHSNHHHHHHHLYDLERALSTTDSILHEANVAQPHHYQAAVDQYYYANATSQPPQLPLPQYYSTATDMYSTVSQSPRPSFDSLSSSSRSCATVSSYNTDPYSSFKKRVTFAATNTITWYDAGTDQDVDQAWYSAAHYQQFEADNRHIVARVLAREKATSPPPPPPPQPLNVDQDEYSTHGLEQYIGGRKPMLQRKLGILQHAAMVLEMYEEQRRVGNHASDINTATNHQNAQCEQQQQQQQQQHRMWMDPELIRKVSLRFSREPLQRAVARAAALAESTKTGP